MSKELFSPKEAAKILGVSVITLQRWDIAGNVQGDLDRQVLFIKEKLDLRIYLNITIITDVGSGLNDQRKGLVNLWN